LAALNRAVLGSTDYVTAFPRISLAISVNFFPGWLIRDGAADNWSVGRCGGFDRRYAGIVRKLQVAAMSTSR
jgi:hypothetical protein